MRLIHVSFSLVTATFLLLYPALASKQSISSFLEGGPPKPLFEIQKQELLALISHANAGNTFAQLLVAQKIFSHTEKGLNISSFIEAIKLETWSSIQEAAKLDQAFIHLLITKKALAEFPELINFIKDCAAKGEPSAQFHLGLIYNKDSSLTVSPEQAVEWYTKAAKQGYAAAQYRLGKLYAKGKGVEENQVQAVHWMTLASNQGYANAQSFLGSMHANGAGVEEDEEQAVHWVTLAANQGHARAQNNLGWSYANGKGIEKDEKQAVHWFTLAANQGDGDAQYNLGWAYANGEGVKEDKEQAVYWFTLAATQGHAVAQYELGLAYQEGEGVEEDEKQAVHWFTLAANQGDEDAQYELGVIYESGKTVTQDHQKSIEWFTLAADQGNIAACHALAQYYLKGAYVEKDLSKVFFWKKKAAKQGDAEAQYNVGWRFTHGKGTTKDLQKAIKWYSRAAEQGQSSAQNSLANLYERGEGFTKDVGRAFELYSQAAAQGNMYAQYNLARLYQNGQGPEQSVEKAFRWYKEAAAQGHKLSQYEIAKDYRYGRGTEKNIAEAIIWHKKAAKQRHIDSVRELGSIFEQYYNNLINIAYKKNSLISTDSDSDSNLDWGDELEFKDKLNLDIDGKTAIAKAIKWYSRAGEQGDQRSQRSLGGIYSSAKGEETDGLKAVTWYRRAAAQGDSYSSYKLGELYEKGCKGIEPDIHTAIECYKQAIEQDPLGANKYSFTGRNAADRLAALYREGKKLPRDMDEAIKWFKESAARGNGYACYTLGEIYEQGLNGLAKDSNKALEWYAKAAEEKNEQAYYKLGTIYEENGHYAPAIAWYQKAQETKYCFLKIKKNAQYRLGVMYANGRGVKEDKAESTQWYLKAANGGHAEAQWRLGYAYSTGEGITHDPIQAFNWYTKAAQQGNSNAYVSLGYAYHYGKGTAPDLVEAVKWYKKAAEKGNANGKYYLGLMYQYGTGVAQDYIETLKWYFLSNNNSSQQALKKLFSIVPDKGNAEVAEDPCLTIEKSLETLVGRHQLQAGMNNADQGFKESAYAIPSLGNYYQKIVEDEINLLNLFIKVRNASPGLLINCLQPYDSELETQLLVASMADKLPYAAAHHYKRKLYLTFKSENVSLAHELVLFLNDESSPLFFKTLKRLDKVSGFYKKSFKKQMARAIEVQGMLSAVNGKYELMPEEEQNSLGKELKLINKGLETLKHTIKDFKEDRAFMLEIKKQAEAYITNSAKRNKSFLEENPFFNN